MTTSEILTTHTLEARSLGSENQCVIDLQGGLVSSLVLGGKDIFWQGIRPGDKKRAASHLCFPYFGPGKSIALAGLQVSQHGTARSALWQEYSRTKSASELILKIPGLETVYPDLHAYSSIGIGKKRFTQILTADNRSNTLQQISPGLHWYWKIPYDQAEKIKINGERYSLDNWLQAKLILIDSENLIETPIGQFKITQKGFSQIALWTQPDADFLCIEPAQDPDNIDDLVNTIKPLEMRHWSAVIDLIS